MCGLSAAPNAGEHLLTTVLYRSLTTAETDARHLRRKNVKALQLGIEQSDREAKEKTAAATAKAVRLAKRQNRAIRRMNGYISSSYDNSDVTNGSDDPPLPSRLHLHRGLQPLR